MPDFQREHLIQRIVEYNMEAIINTETTKDHPRAARERERERGRERERKRGRYGEGVLALAAPQAWDQGHRQPRMA